MIQIPRLPKNTKVVFYSMNWRAAAGTILEVNSMPKSMVIYDYIQLSIRPSPNIVKQASQKLNYYNSF